MSYGLKVYNTEGRTIIDSEQDWAWGTAVEYLGGGSEGVLPISTFNPTAREELLFVRANSSWFTSNNKTRYILSLERNTAKPQEGDPHPDKHIFVQDFNTGYYDAKYWGAGISVCIVRPHNNSYFNTESYGLKINTSDNRALVFDSSLFEMKYKVDVRQNWSPKTFSHSPQAGSKIHEGLGFWTCANFLTYETSSVSMFIGDYIVGIMYAYNDPELGTGAYYVGYSRRKDVDPRLYTTNWYAIPQYSNILVATISG